MKSVTTKRFREKFIVCLIVGLAGTQSIYLIQPRPEIWPFSSYPMFSFASLKKTTSTLEIRGVTADGKEIPLDFPTYFAPFDRVRLRAGIFQVLREEAPEKQEKILDTQFQYLLSQYEQNRMRSNHAGPPITGLHLYRLDWNWTHTAPETAVPSIHLTYSTTKRLVHND